MHLMRSATFVKGLRKPGKFYNRGGLMLTAAPTGGGQAVKLVERLPRTGERDPGARAYDL